MHPNCWQKQRECLIRKVGDSVAHDKVYGIDESKSRIEVMQSSKGFGIIRSQTFAVEKGSNATLSTGSLQECNTRIVVKNYKNIIFNGKSDSFTDNYNFQVIFYSESGFLASALPSDLISFYIDEEKYAVKYLSTFKLSTYTVIQFNFFYDGITLCCRCEGYAK